jgi:type IV pilus assembly protein PilB
MYPTQEPVFEALRVRGVRPEQLQEALAAASRSGRLLRDVLIDQRVVTEVELAEALAEAYGLKTVELSTVVPDQVAIDLIPRDLSRRHRVLGLAIEGDAIVVAIADPGDVLALDDVRAATGLSVVPVVAPKDELNKTIDRIARAETDFGDVSANANDDLSGGFGLTVAAEDVPIVRYVNSLIERAISDRASDLHLEPTEHELRVRFRIDGVLHEIDAVPRNVQSALISRLKIMAAIDITERRVPQNGRISMELGTRSVDLRVATLPTVWGEKIVIRVLDTGGVQLDLRELGFSQDHYEKFATSFNRPHGMVLVTGPTGSGKSTTLYATLTEISKPEVNIITVEDPVEYRLPGVNQIQVNPKAGLTFAAVLPAILRSDPDIVLIGEIRDRVTAQLAVEAALTGHLVLATLHTNDAPSAVTRLIEMGVEPFLVGSSLECVLAQRLARRLCRWCQQSYTPTAAELAAARWPLEEIPAPVELWQPVGCRSCANTGYRGRIGINEIMPMTEEIERMAVEHASARDIQGVAVANGMELLRYDGMRKAAIGETSLAEVIRVTV